MHSLKGFDYACVFVLGIDWLAPGNRWTEEQIKKLAYVAVTRAREQLFTPYQAVSCRIMSNRWEDFWEQWVAV